ncbi:uncharacterized protein V1510DRAFT_412464 [Dipodascopsis tothii]|uniref:uncharacterized protein n=1 Tax=Dipodascopsis tothii TaxID=44089 RepID=UPI0034CF9213
MAASGRGAGTGVRTGTGRRPTGTRPIEPAGDGARATGAGGGSVGAVAGRVSIGSGLGTSTASDDTRCGTSTALAGSASAGGGDRSADETVAECSDRTDDAMDEIDDAYSDDDDDRVDSPSAGRRARTGTASPSMASVRDTSPASSAGDAKSIAIPIAESETRESRSPVRLLRLEPEPTGRRRAGTLGRPGGRTAVCVSDMVPAQECCSFGRSTRSAKTTSTDGCVRLPCESVLMSVLAGIASVLRCEPRSGRGCAGGDVFLRSASTPAVYAWSTFEPHAAPARRPRQTVARGRTADARGTARRAEAGAGASASGRRLRVAVGGRAWLPWRLGRP